MKSSERSFGTSIPINQSINQPSNHGSINQSINQSINNGSINQSIDRSINQSINQSINRSINQSINQSIDGSINQSTDQSIMGQSINGIVRMKKLANVVRCRWCCFGLNDLDDDCFGFRNDLVKFVICNAIRVEEEGFWGLNHELINS